MPALQSPNVTAGQPASGCPEEGSARVLSRGVVLSTDEGLAGNGGSLRDMRIKGTNPVTRRNTVTSTERAGQGNRATSLLYSLDKHLQYGKTTVTRKNMTAHTGGSKSDERKWSQHAQKMASDQAARDKLIESQPIDRQTLIAATTQLCCSATLTVIDVLCVMFEECSNYIQIGLAVASKSEEENELFGGYSNSIYFNPPKLRTTHIDPSLLVGIEKVSLYTQYTLVHTLYIYIHTHTHTHLMFHIPLYIRWKFWISSDRPSWFFCTHYTAIRTVLQW